MKKIFILCLIVMSLLLPAVSLLASDDWVVMNIKTYIYHSPSCNAAKTCTRNCIKISKQAAEEKGGRPCMRCGG